jgi:uroporphyrinogen decarboxylase
MTHRERFIAALTRSEPTGRVPTFELVYFLTMELLGKVHPSHRVFRQWDQMSRAEKNAQVGDAANVFIETARHYEHSAIFVHAVGGMPESVRRIAENIRERTGDEFFLMCHGDSTMSIPDGNRMVDLSYRLADEPEQIKADQERALDLALRRAEDLRDVFDGFALCADYCLNTGPFLSPAQFGEFVTPYLTRLIAGYRDQGFYTIKHTDGNIMPIIDQLVSAKPDALHSLDPQANVDIAEVKRRYGDQVCLIGNVNCGLLQTGTEDEVRESVRYALRHGMPGGGYIFSTSNCVYTGMPIERYELMMALWRAEGNYPAGFGPGEQRNG